MTKSWNSVILLLGVWAVAQAIFSSPAEAQLTPSFYEKSCPNLFSIVGKYVHSAIQNESRIAASLLRLHFHDCFVQGCDASDLLDDTPLIQSEKDSLPNKNSLRGFAVIDSIKAGVEKACPNVVSCADILTLASFFSVVLSGGPVWRVPLGRRDAFEANFNLTSNLPGPTFNISQLKAKFAIQKLTSTDLVALSGGHTIGLARCASITSRLYNFGNSGGPDPTLNKTLLAALEKRCPNTADSNAGNVTNKMDLTTPTVFDNLYFKQLLVHKGVFASDEELYTAAADTKALVQLYANNQTKFFVDFAASMTKMGNLNPLTGKAGEIRKNCRVRNPLKTIIEEEEETVASETREEEAEGALNLFQRAIEKVMEEIVGEELEGLIEDTVSGLNLSM